ncbi:MAG TPA: hypothetical protein VFR37_21135 [Longimicrobium sp.]|nr:hypothetical protein [Longimicrobium sp.]
MTPNAATLQAPARASVRTHPTAGVAAVPWHVWAVLFASTSVIVGVLWDISWHQTIGRDTFWSPPHMAMYLGGVVSGVACGWHVLHTSFAGAPEDRVATVTFWKYFHGALGAWVCIWGAIAMLTSAPFDDWWHNAYGLDVKILSPPHALLGLGILAIQLGAMLMVLALQNRHGDTRAFRWMFAYAAGLVLLNLTTLSSEYTWRIYQHGTLFWQVVAGLVPLVLVAPAVAGRLRWPATAAAAAYTGTLLALTFILPLFPAEPRLAPIRYNIEAMMPPQFPMLLVVPAIALDLILQRWGERKKGWMLAAVLGTAFLAVFVAVQWPFADVLQALSQRETILHQELRPYMVGPQALFARGEYLAPASGMALAKGLGIALALAIVSARAGLGWGAFMARVKR